MYKKIHKKMSSPLEAEHMAVDTGTDQATGWGCEHALIQRRKLHVEIFSLNINISKVLATLCFKIMQIM